MPEFLDLYATRLDYELGTNDSNVLFTTARRKNSLNEGLREFADLTECWTRESTIANGKVALLAFDVHKPTRPRGSATEMA